MKSRSAMRLAWSLCGIGMLISLASLFLYGLSFGERVPEEFGSVETDVLDVVVGVCVLVLGAVIAATRRRNPIGWILLVAALAFSIGGFSAAYALRGLITAPGSLPASDVAGWAYQWVWALGFAPIPLVLLLFPDGRPLSRRWWLVAAMVSGAVVLIVGPVAGVMWSRRGVQLFLDPNQTEGLNAAIPFFVAAAVLFLGATALAAVQLIVRFRRAAGDQRLQLKWLAAAGAVWAVFIVIDSLAEISSAGVVGQLLSILFFLLIPVSVAIAILKYRLYDIDVVINRTLVYGSLTAILGLVYVALVFLFQRVLSPLTAESDLAIAGSTLAVAALFRPLRARVQGFIDRRFYRSKYDAQRILQSFSERLRDEIGLETLETHVREVVIGTVQPRAVSIWLRPTRDDGRDGRRAATLEPSHREVP